MFVQVARMKAPAPMMGGISCPPVLADASMAPAKKGLNPERRISGMVNVPVVTTFATALPERDPMKALATAAVFAGPPWLPPATRSARPISNPPPPAMSRRAPNRTNRYTKSADTPRGTPHTPSVER